MPEYTINFYRFDTKKQDSKTVNTNTMKEAVSAIVQKADTANVKITDICASVEGSTGLQQYCSTCLFNEAPYGVKGKYFCKAHVVIMSLSKN